jgi:hypothetical protein
MAPIDDYTISVMRYFLEGYEALTFALIPRGWKISE